MASNAIRAILLLVVALLVVRDDVGGLFYLLVLAAFSVNRFLLAGLSASLPHVVSRELLVTANGVSPTCGTLAYLSGVAFGGAVHALSHSDGIVLVVGAVSYFLSALLAWRLPNLGPDLEGIDNAVREALGNVVRGLGDAARHLPPLGRLALGVVGAGQLPYGVTVMQRVRTYRSGASGNWEVLHVIAGRATLDVIEARYPAAPSAPPDERQGGQVGPVRRQ